MDECYIEQAYIELQIEQITLKNFENRFHFENQITKTSQVFLLFVMIYLPKCTLSLVIYKYNKIYPIEISFLVIFFFILKFRLNH